MEKIPLAPILEAQYGISEMTTKEELQALVDRLRSEDKEESD